MSEHYPATGTQVALVLLFNLIQFAFVEVPIVGFLIAPERTATLVRRITGGIKLHAQRIVVVIMALVGVYLIVHGIDGLVN